MIATIGNETINRDIVEIGSIFIIHQRSMDTFIYKYTNID